MKRVDWDRGKDGVKKGEREERREREGCTERKSEKKKQINR